MGDTGQGTSNGGGGGTTRASAGPANISQMQALAKKSGSAADQQLANEIDRIIRTTRITASDQDPGDTQKFFNAIGYMKNKPKTVKTENDLEKEIKAGNQSTDYPYYIFHGDSATSAKQGKAFAEQLHGKTDQYLPSGRLGDGIYFSTSPTGSAGYMDSRYGRQTKAILNKKAKIISDRALDSKIMAFSSSHPKAYKAIMNMQGSKNDSWGSSSKKSVFAALFGYNVISDGRGSKTYDHYTSVFDRSVLTVVTGKTLVSNNVYNQASRGYKGWDYRNPGET